jgi:hypothetical protein
MTARPDPLRCLIENRLQMCLELFNKQCITIALHLKTLASERLRLHSLKVWVLVYAALSDDFIFVRIKCSDLDFIFKYASWQEAKNTITNN